MCEEKTITLTFKYKEGREWTDFWRNQIADRVAYAKPNGDIKVTTWYSGRDCVTDLKEIEYQQQLKGGFIL